MMGTKSYMTGKKVDGLCTKDLNFNETSCCIYSDCNWYKLKQTYRESNEETCVMWASFSKDALVYEMVIANGQNVQEIIRKEDFGVSFPF